MALNPLVQEALDKLDMESYLDREGVDYTRSRGSRGIQLNVRECPCCGNEKAKVFLNAETGLGNCFAGDCEMKFNKFKFIRAHTGLFGKALDEHILQVGEELGWRPPKRTAEVQSDTELIIPKSFPLPIKGRNLAYLENRGIAAEVAEYFHLRFCQKGWFKYKDPDGNDKFMFFGSRVIIPVYDMKGELVSFQGRDITGEADKKYLFPPGFAATGEHLYNGQNVQDAESIIINEGAFDVIATHIAMRGDSSTRLVVPVGTFGKHLSAQQLEKLRELRAVGLKSVTMMWDAEPQAIEDAVKAALQIRAIGLEVRVAILPAGKDPNEVPPDQVRLAYWQAITIASKGDAVKILLRVRGMKAA